MRSTALRRADARASVRAPARDIAPELDAICVRATAVKREDRFSSARELYDAVEGFLAGDRDVERRGTLAREHGAAATLATDLALAGGPGAAAERTRAMKEVSRAVALDPSNAEAMRSLVRHFTGDAAHRDPARGERRTWRAPSSTRSGRPSRSASIGCTRLARLRPARPLDGRPPGRVGALCDVLFLGAAIASAYVARAREAYVPRAADVALLLSRRSPSSAATGVVGPFILIPGVAAVNTILYVGSADRSRRRWAIAAGCAAIAVPFALTLLGWLPPAVTFDGGSLIFCRRSRSSPASPPSSSSSRRTSPSS